MEGQEYVEEPCEGEFCFLNNIQLPPGIRKAERFWLPRKYYLRPLERNLNPGLNPSMMQVTADIVRMANTVRKPLPRTPIGPLTSTLEEEPSPMLKVNDTPLHKLEETPLAAVSHLRVE